MPTCNDCIYRPKCISFIVHGMGDDEINGGLLTDMDKRCKDFKNKTDVIVPPCKVGDTVYEFFDARGFYSINELIVENLVIGMNPPKCNIYTKTKFGNSRDVYYQESFGKILFFTKEKAEEVERWHLEQP